MSYGINAASELRDIAQEAVRSAIILVILERLFLTPNSSWLEQHIDYISLHTLLVRHYGLTFKAQVEVFWRHTRRLSD